ncbi:MULTISPECIES: GDP-L-fucose synthase [Chloracidobacterium]|jgi:GDP-L-fucose synthase|uniref:GDP-L-fucose synthase n=1 Tax=Chloracidobacterium thermophilum (strain B) TaxID=981222 RepID=G2LF42_CHLTF|nr:MULTISPECIES: GDP-L-fucose synthase [Chloracidobacterium]AEP12970.1 Nucleoside-diphosphate-sugar epimerase [Chloracidobacterium thermophilum B]QUV78687.1 GDP-L-fucose synthase [Chloracidobacterium thermophilum]QUV81733.1 GDP-L-fucose synthase [Chloracidobacterium sp. D]
MEKDAKIYVAGHRGLVGSAIVRKLRAEGYTNLLLRTRAELDLTRQMEVEAFFAAERPAYVFLAAAKVGGILANDTYGGDFIRDNLLIQTHIIEAARRTNVQKLLFLGSSCIYPKFAPQPMPEDCLLTGILEPTNEPYAVAKIAGLTMVKAYRKQYGFNGISLMPTNLYGPGDNFDLTSSHVLAALLRKFHEAKLTNAPTVTVWGTGKPRREFLHVDDLADAALFLMQHYEDDKPINVGVGEDISIGELAMLIRDIVGYAGDIVYDTAKPDGTPRKLLDVSRLHALGWRAQIHLREGIAATYTWYCAHHGR